MEKSGITNRIAEKADLLTELQPLESVVELYGNQRVLVENHHGICEYTGKKIVVFIKCGRLCVTGDRMHVVLMSKNRLVIQGCVDSVAVCKEGRNG